MTKKTGLSAPMPLRRHHDDDYWDDIRIEARDALVTATIIPRYKTSGFNGDEWRVSAQLRVAYNGDDLVVRPFSRMRSLTEYAPHFFWTQAQGLMELRKATMTVRRKGVVLLQHGFKCLGDAAIGIGWHIVTANEGSPDIKWHHLTTEEELARCQQVGCDKPPKNVFRLKKLLEDDKLVKPKYDFVGQYTWYCARHTRRGDGDLEDSDKNLVLVAGNGVAREHAEDESPSALAVIDLSGES